MIKDKIDSTDNNFKNNGFIKVLAWTDKIVYNYENILNNITNFDNLDSIISYNNNLNNINKYFDGNKAQVCSTVQKNKFSNYHNKENWYSENISIKSKKSMITSNKLSSNSITFNENTPSLYKTNNNKPDKIDIEDFNLDNNIDLGVQIMDDIDNNSKIESIKSMIKMVSGKKSIFKEDNLNLIMNDNEDEDDDFFYEISDHESYEDIDNLKDDNDNLVLQYCDSLNIKLFENEKKINKEISQINFFNNPDQFRENFNNQNVEKKLFCNNRRIPLWSNDLNTFEENEKNKYKFKELIKPKTVEFKNSELKEIFEISTKQRFSEKWHLFKN